MMLTYVAHPNTEPYIIKHGDRVGQLLFLSPGKVNMGVNFVEVLDPGIGDPDKTQFIPTLRRTDRGAGGFGSTGR
jgi:dUTPase